MALLLVLLPSFEPSHHPRWFVGSHGSLARDPLVDVEQEAVAAENVGHVEKVDPQGLRLQVFAHSEQAKNGCRRHADAGHGHVH